MQEGTPTRQSSIIYINVYLQPPTNWLYLRHPGLDPGSRAIMDRSSYVYILASRRNGTLYTGVTSDIVKRVWEHKNKFVKGFSEKYGVDKLVYVEEHGDIGEAILREKRIKVWKRKWKLELIEKQNPEWKDLFDDIIEH